MSRTRKQIRQMDTKPEKEREKTPSSSTIYICTFAVIKTDNTKNVAQK